MPTDQSDVAGGAGRVLILGGTAEARELAAECADRAGIATITSLAGATSAPRRPAGEVRIGGFGGTERLAGYLRAQRITAVVDATHPFAAAITMAAAEAAAAVAVPLLVLRRPGWSQPDRDQGGAWRRVPSAEAAAALLPDLGERVLLTTGRRSLAAFADVDDCWFLSRSIEPPRQDPSLRVPRRLTVLLDRGPYTVDGERALLTERRIDVLVTKDSGGPAGKLSAAADLHIPVVMIDRPPLPPGVATVGSVAEVLDRLATGPPPLGPQRPGPVG